MNYRGDSDWECLSISKLYYIVSYLFCFRKDARVRNRGDDSIYLIIKIKDLVDLFLYLSF